MYVCGNQLTQNASLLMYMSVVSVCLHFCDPTFTFTCCSLVFLSLCRTLFTIDVVVNLFFKSGCGSLCYVFDPGDWT